MAMSVVYTTVNGQILSESRGGTVSHFVSDPLGSVVMVRDTSGNTVYEAEYDPYGNVQSEAGTNPSSLGYVGTLGYIKDSATSMYVRARYLLNNLGRWLTKDPLWPSEPGFVYAGAAPNMRVDPSGRRTRLEEKASCEKEAKDAIEECLARVEKIYDFFNEFCKGLPPAAQAHCRHLLITSLQPLYVNCLTLGLILTEVCRAIYLACVGLNNIEVVAAIIGAIAITISLVLLCKSCPPCCALLIPPTLRSIPIGRLALSRHKSQNSC